MQIFVGLTLLGAAILIVWFGRPEMDGWFSAAIKRREAGGAAALLVTAFIAFGITLIVKGALGVLQ